ncbi:enoyl-CoA hydratase/isomerase family protein [Pseudonocardia sp. RS11V-5]|uniref:enoyl-CoA hydratase/isomerase family protein n=1 Tax=Pseudonocardia terrae TaxID=2905831 RepID=UPI001E568A6E|nr:enoyl-CoA hydratase/isomerase family protein [Pseudonocardia terrae]MCE3554651.1 enoyl-CoA hydratase/isomerase family protein [Pseudonocardia terrae]
MSLVSYDVSGSVARVTLNRPDNLNAVNAELTRGVGAAFGRAVADPAVRVVILDAEGRAFCAGADLKDPNTHSGDDLLAHLEPAEGSGLGAVAACPKPVVVAAQGWCVGAGVELVLAADIAVVADDAKFFLPQVALGIVPGAGGMSRLLRKVGPTWAHRLVMLGEKLPAEVALRIGLVSEIVPRDTLAQRAAEIAEVLAAAPPAAQRLAKESLLQAADLPLAAALRVDQYRLFMLSDTAEKKERHAAFAAERSA